jgi:tetratricopeptide (TPR) repeat protein
MLIDLYCTLGLEDEARHAFARADAAALPRSADWLTAVALLCEAAARLGEAAAARRLYELLAPHAERNAVLDRGWATWGPVARTLGHAAAALGDREAAVAHFEAARAGAERMGARPWADLAARAHAELLGER